jgi:hypothetical protein
METEPRVGSVMRASTFNSVLLPAPLRPTIPTTSPRRMLKETSCRAQKSSLPDGASVPRAGVTLRHSRRARSATASRSVSWRGARPIR